VSEPIWTADNLVHYPLIEHVHLAPDSRQFLFTARRPHLTDDISEFRRTVYLAQVAAQPVADAAPVPLTHDTSAEQPRWSPDGRQIAFIRPTPDTGKPGLWVMPADGGEPRPLTGKANGIQEAVTRFEWRPDGNAIAFLAVPHDETLAERRRAKDDAVHHQVDYAFAHLHLVDVQAATDALPPVTPLTQGRLHVFGFNWRPDGAEIALLHMPTPYIDGWPETRLATVAIPPGDVPELTDRGRVSSLGGNPHYSPDGAWIACEVGDEDLSWIWGNRVFLFPVAGGDPRILAPASDDQPFVLGWRPDSRAVYVNDQQGRGTAILALPIDGGAPHTLIPADRLITALHINAQGQIALVAEDFDAAQAVYVADLTAAQPTLQRVAQPHTAAYPDGPLPQVRLLDWQTPDGLTIEGVLYLPADYDPARDDKLPLLLHVHGGPASIFQRQFAATPYYYTPAALCERGIAVLRCNPRGSGGYGKPFRGANREDWGGGDFRDLMQGVDLVIDQGIADPDRLGIAGWSYGGFMTSWTITQTNRFKAASVGAAVTNLISFIGTADIPGFIPSYFGGEIWERRDLLLEHSPIMHAHKVQTPAIIQHGGADERVPPEQGLQYFTALKRRGVPVEMYIYPRQPHAIGEPRLLADAIRRNLDWFTAQLTTPLSP